MNISTPIWSAQQDQALQMVRRWHKAQDSPLFYLAGYAGTGKTTLARELAGDIGNVLFGAFTGKAASVMRAKGCHGANTLHSLIYRPVEAYYCPTHPEQPIKTIEGSGCNVCGRVLKLRHYPEFVLNEESALHDANLLIVDECSMVDAQLGGDVMSFGVPVLTIGDPAQLPPVRGEGFFTSNEPDIVLTEIHRQAQGNPIIEMATRVREGRRLLFGGYGDSVVKRKAELGESDLANNSIRLAGKNKSVQWLNDVWRSADKRTDPLPEEGERILCLRNNPGKGLLNGTLWDVKKVLGKNEHMVRMEIAPEEGGFVREVTAPAKFFHALAEGEEQWPTNQSFRFGYAMTVHKAQGSEWDDVLVFDESGLWGREAKNWLYTAITRASERVTVIRG